MELKATHTYRGLCSHGRVRAMVVDVVGMEEDTAEDVAQFIKGGMTIDRVTIEEGRKSEMFCDDCSKK